MSKKITISIPNSSGVQTFDVSRKTLFTSIAVIAGTLISGVGYGYYQWHQEQTTQQKYHALVDKLSELEVLYEEQVDTTHSLSQELEDKRNQIHVLGKRVYDVESVLGLADESLTDDASLENRIDAAAVDSAVRATMFRLIPNDTPMNYERISSSFGRRTNPITGKRHTHTGIDLTCKRGEEIYAPADGVIETVRPSKKGFGNFLTVRHSFGFMSSYAHLHQFKVRSGQFVSKGDLIATCGNSGNSTGPHLHYEVRFLGRALNPQYTMDWTPENFNYLFEKEKKVKWAPLVKLIDDTVRLQVNLTNNPYQDSSVSTVKNDQEPQVDNLTVQ
ncbi:M23 family metallopeptidase [Vibrio europaeus]|uniref:M23 family metallopeptidase n=1 Tax=Vibrio europaeus TaxID=300876 RepID=UPI0018A7D429|nr:M23 family metallopeptidase [Vibrio europaeus]MDC5804180.1 M23 family metallopeptidase [Vibrio europaeus]MDC5809138.1 M23 family metallopeptidase [Vibrio europaeus]MDC5824767.1 M23 family metallopeptidase [Vibrio europaeus]MDC5829188.1 M23 family metallopeptidase [Vibrio europaeus]MDC5835706.1 M23 family metallopeptidase [Vibrio europaeus]